MADTVVVAQLLQRPTSDDDAQAFAELTARVEAAASGLLTLSMRASVDLPGGLSLTQLRALATAERIGPCTLATLADALVITTSTASRLVDRLVAVGVLDRRASELNRREVTLRVTASGRRLLRRHDASRRAIFAAVLGRMTGAEVRALLRGLEAVQRQLDAG